MKEFPSYWKPRASPVVSIAMQTRSVFPVSPATISRLILVGCDGDRLYYDGCAMIVVNGEIVAQGSQFSCTDVEVITATVDLETVRAYRFAPSRNFQAIQAPKYNRIEVDFNLGNDDNNFKAPTLPRAPRYHLPEEEIVGILVPGSSQRETKHKANHGCK